MKKALKFLCVAFTFVALFAFPALAQEAESSEVGSFLKDNWVAILAIWGGVITVLKMIAKLTPTKKDDKIVAFIEKLSSLFMPDLEKK